MPYKDAKKQKEYSQKNKDVIKKKHQIYYAKPEIKEKQKKYNKEYYDTPKGKANKLKASTKWRNNNLEKARKYAREYAKANPLKQRKMWLKRKYNISLDSYRILLESQSGKCAICYNENDNKRHKYLCVDHNHDTGKVRGLLCHSCNATIGYAKESVSTLKKSIEYLEKYL